MCKGKGVLGWGVLSLLSPKALVTFSTSSCRRLSLCGGLPVLVVAGTAPLVLTAHPSLVQKQLKHLVSCGAAALSSMQLAPARALAEGSVLATGKRGPWLLPTWYQGALLLFAGTC